MVEAEGILTEKDGAATGNIRISVALPSYNGERFLGEQLDSILMQLGPQDEIIISDDGSTDGTIRIIQEYQNEHSCIRFLQGPQEGVKKNVEWALSHCSGQYIFLADQDDIWMPGKVEQVLKIFEERRANLVIHDAVVFDSDSGKPILDSFFSFRQSKAGIVKNLVKNSYIGCCMAFRAQLLAQVLPIPDQIEMHDQWIGVLNDFYYRSSCFYEKPLIFYRRHGENSSGMTHYGIGKMIRNRVVFLWHFLRRISCKRAVTVLK